MLDLLRASDKQHKITLTHSFVKDLHWFQTFLPQFNGTAFFDHPKVQGEIALDASLVGVGAHFENAVYAIQALISSRDVEHISRDVEHSSSTGRSPGGGGVNAFSFIVTAMP